MPSTADTLAAARGLHAMGKLHAAAERYRDALASIELSNKSAKSAALLGLGQIALESSQAAAALRIAGAVLAANPNSTPAWEQAGHALMVLRRGSEAETAFRHALTLNPHSLHALIGLGELLTASFPTDAAALFHHALQLRPGLAAAHYGLGNTLAAEEHFEAALDRFQQVLAISPRAPEAYFAIGFCYARLGHHRRAIAAYIRAVHLRPQFPSAWINLGAAFAADGLPLPAERCYRQAIAIDPNLISPYLNLGNLERGRRRFAEAHQIYQQALAIDPNHCGVLTALCYLLLDENRLLEAAQTLQHAEQIHSEDPEVSNARGILLLAQGEAEARAESQWRLISRKIEEAIEAFHQAEALGHKTAASNRGNALLRLGRCTEALDAHALAVERNPTHPGARYNLALTQLRLGDFAHGWANYEIRWSFRGLHPQPRRFSQPVWQGEPLLSGSGAQSLLIYGEQGLGDTIQFARYLPLVAQRLAGSGIRILVEIQKSLVQLLTPFVVSQGGKVIAHGDLLPKFSWHIPLLSLPHLFSTTVETIPFPGPYLQLPSEWLERTRPAELSSSEKLATLRVGLAWAGNPNYRADSERSTHLDNLVPILQVPGIQWVSLQKGTDPDWVAHEIARLPLALQSRILDHSSTDRDLADTAATIASLDLVITTDTVIAHLAGAMGKPLWLLLPWQSDWRWMQQRTGTPWYPSARLFRQQAPGDWAELASCVAGELFDGILQGLFAEPFRTDTPAADRDRTGNGVGNNAEISGLQSNGPRSEGVCPVLLRSMSWSTMSAEATSPRQSAPPAVML